MPTSLAACPAPASHMVATTIAWQGTRWMGDFEDTFGAGADAASIIDSFAHQFERSVSGATGVETYEGTLLGALLARKAFRVIDTVGDVTPTDCVVGILTGKPDSTRIYASEHEMFGFGPELSTSDWLLLIQEMYNQGYLYEQEPGRTLGDECLRVCGDMRRHFDNVEYPLCFRVNARLYPSVTDAEYRLFMKARDTVMEVLAENGMSDWYSDRINEFGLCDDLVIIQMAAVKPTSPVFIDRTAHSNKLMFYRFFDDIVDCIKSSCVSGDKMDNYMALSNFYIFEPPNVRSRSRNGDLC